MLRIYDFYSGECLAKMPGHSELVTGVKFTRDCKRIISYALCMCYYYTPFDFSYISVAGDGCIFVWKLSPDFTKSMKDRLAERNPSVPSTPSPQSNPHPYSISPSNLPIGAATPVSLAHARAPNVSPIVSVLYIPTQNFNVNVGIRRLVSTIHMMMMQVMTSIHMEVNSLAKTEGNNKKLYLRLN